MKNLLDKLFAGTGYSYRIHTCKFSQYEKRFGKMSYFNSRWTALDALGVNKKEISICLIEYFSFDSGGEESNNEFIAFIYESTKEPMHALYEYLKQLSKLEIKSGYYSHTYTWSFLDLFKDGDEIKISELKKLNFYYERLSKLYGVLDAHINRFEYNFSKLFKVDYFKKVKKRKPIH